MPLLIGSDNEPIHLNLSYPGMEGMIEVSSCFPKSSSLFVIRVRNVFSCLLNLN